MLLSKLAWKKHGSWFRDLGSWFIDPISPFSLVYSVRIVSQIQSSLGLLARVETNILGLSELKIVLCGVEPSVRILTDDIRVVFNVHWVVVKVVVALTGFA